MRTVGTGAVIEADPEAAVEKGREIETTIGVLFE